MLLLFSLMTQLANGQVVFVKHTLTQDFISEGVAIGDVNNDGKLDIMAGPCWFEAPEWKRHEIGEVKKLDPEIDYSHSFLNFSMDVNQDGWIDLIVIDFPGTTATWFENPRNKAGHWKGSVIYKTLGNESPTMADVDGDGRLDIIGADTTVRQMIWLKSPSQGMTTWQKFEISAKNAPGSEIFSHGLGFGDINSDGRKDVIIREGWWEGPIDPKQPNWKFHSADLGNECSQMYVLDVNGDMLPDVVSASAHLSGIWWHEQIKEKESTRWEQHVISDAFAESHAVVLADINGDGHLDIVTGKRDLHRNTWRKNPGTHGPPLLYWYEFELTAPYWIPHQIDNASGAGLNLVAQDMNKDGLTDIVISNFKGVFYFENKR